MSDPSSSSVAWTDAIAVADTREDDVIGLVVAGLDLAIYNAAGEIFATDNLCTHGNGRLCDGFFDGQEIECPLHQGRFDVRTGQPTCAPVTAAVRSYPVRIEGGRVFLALD